VKVGVVAVQGAVTEHMEVVERALEAEGLSGTAIPVRRRGDLDRVAALIVPGGESTTISKLLVQNGLHDAVVSRAVDGMPVMGTCAGCILLAKRGDEQVEDTETRLLGLMDMAVNRNAFGRQRESFEAELRVEGMEGTFRGVFIRSPAITETWGSCRPLAALGGVVVLAQQGHLVASAFHPELSQDLRLHRRFVELV
jgi:5'-phosphate synthase pdxT subunit